MGAAFASDDACPALTGELRRLIDAFPADDGDACDRVESAFSIAVTAVELALSQADADRLSAWSEEDDPGFLYFMSGLKSLLEVQKNWLDSHSAPLLAEDTIASRKIQDGKDLIAALADEEKGLLQKNADLLAEEAELRERQSRLHELKKRLEAATAARKELEQVDIDRLADEADEAETEAEDLRLEIQPLAELKEQQARMAEELRERREELQADLDNLEETFGIQAGELADRLPERVKAVRTRIPEREERARRELDDLAEATDSLRAAEAELQEYLARSRRLADAAEDFREIMDIRFQADRHIGASFDRSVSGMEARLKEQENTAEAALQEYENRLETLRRELQAIADQMAETMQVTG